MVNSVQSIYTQNLSDGKTIVEKLQYDGVSYWWFIDNNLYSPNLEEKSVKHIIASIISTLITFPLVLKLAILIFGYLNKLISRSGGTVNKKHKQSQTKYDVLFRFSFIEWRKTNVLSDYVNIYNGDICNELDYNNVDILSLYQELPIKNLMSLSDMCKWIHILHSSVGYGVGNIWSYFSAKHCVNTVVGTLLHFKKVWGELKKETNWFYVTSSVLGIDAQILKSNMRKSIFLTIPYVVLCGRCIDNLIQVERPKTIVITDEQTTSGRYIQYLARKYNIPTIGIQHGIITNSSYLNHESLNVATIHEELLNKFPVPDITCVWGDFDYNLLVNEAGYPSSQVIVTGNPRYDNLHHVSIKYNRDDFCRRYRINPKSFLVLWTTQSHSCLDKENHEYFKEIFETFEKNNEITLIIKQHPAESKKYREFIDDYLRKYQMKCTVIVPDKMADTTEMVFCSDILINKYSTTGQEAVVFHKPMIIMDFSETPDMGGFVSEGVGLPVYNPGNLSQTICAIFNGNIDLRAKQDLYVQNHMYKIDGCSANRIAHIITTSLKNKDIDAHL